MQKILILILLCLMFSIKSKAQDSVSRFFVNLNINIVKNNYTNYIAYDQIGSQVKSLMNILKPSILIRTKKRNFREFELTTLSFSSNKTIADGIKLVNPGNNSEKDTSLIYEQKYRDASILVTHRYYWNFLKKKSKKFGFGLSLSNSIGVGFYKIVPLKVYAHDRKDFSIGTSLNSGLFANYQLNNKLLIGIQKNLFSASFQFTKTRVENSSLPGLPRIQKQFNYILNTLQYVPTIFTLNVAYKL